MDKKVLSDLEKMDKDRKKAEEEYMEQKEQVLDIHRILKEGITDGGDLYEYLVFCIKDCEHMEDIARRENNNIMYSETIGIRREFTKLLKLLTMGGEEEEEEGDEDGTEGAHRVNNDGSEGYA